MDPTSLYVRLGAAIATMPELGYNPAPDVMRWLGQAYALVEALGDAGDVVLFKRAMDSLSTEVYTDKIQASARTVVSILHRSLARAEIQAPAAAQGAFIPAGNAFDALVAVGNVLSQAKNTLLIVDPYADEKLLTDFVPSAAEGVQINVLSDEKSVKPSFAPAVKRWQSQYQSIRPLTARISPPRLLHDRLIIVDGSSVWIATQSFNAIASRSPASIVRVDGDAVQLKIDAYGTIWAAANPI
jgi:hypothetical protein